LYIDLVARSVEPVYAFWITSITDIFSSSLESFVIDDQVYTDNINQSNHHVD
jgi:hypothetical protein